MGKETKACLIMSLFMLNLATKYIVSFVFLKYL